MSLSYKIKLLPVQEKIIFKNMLDKCLKLRTFWVKCLHDTSKTDGQCDFALNKLKINEHEFRNRFNYLHMDSFNLSDIKLCFN